jgi:ABC-type dipeptide/oligopeptide/nickel transport system permease component
VVQGGVLFVAVAFVLVNLLVDLVYAYLDPRIRYD